MPDSAGTFDFGAMLDKAERAAELSLRTNDKIMQNHLRHSAVVLNNAELCRQGQTLPAELAAAVALRPFSTPQPGNA